MEHDERIRSVILTLCESRGSEKTVCPSEVARNLFPSDWRLHMEDIRLEARRMAIKGDIMITQGSVVMDPGEPFRGPIRLRHSGQ